MKVVDLVNLGGNALQLEVRRFTFNAPLAQRPTSNIKQANYGAKTCTEVACQ